MNKSTKYPIKGAKDLKGHEAEGLPEGSYRSNRLISYLKGAEGLVGLYYILPEGSLRSSRNL